MTDFSYIIITHNRRQRLLQTLAHLLNHRPTTRGGGELWVVDNASTDGSAEAVARRFGRRVQLIRLRRNIGMPARNEAIRRSSGRYVVLLDDDSYPMDDAVSRCVDYLDAHERTAAVSGRVCLPDGRAEAPALPGVFIGCAAVVRRAALEEVGLFDEMFFRQAEEYDLSFRLASAGWRIERFDDICFRHDKQVAGRPGGLAVEMDLRNNLLLTRRYLPDRQRSVYRRDWAQRYVALARAADQCDAARRGLHGFRAMRADQVCRPMSPSTFQAMFEWDAQARQVADWAERCAVRRVVIGDLGKNVYATWRACRLAGLEVLAVAERAAPFIGLRYRGAPVIDEKSAAALRPGGVVLSNINPAQVERRAEQLRRAMDRPVLTLWAGRTMRQAALPAERAVPAA